LSEHDIRALIRTVVNRGAHRQAISFFADLTQMFGWARKRQPWRALLVEGDPTERVDITPLRKRGGAWLSIHFYRGREYSNFNQREIEFIESVLRRD
jgi:hypothetical protein